jgi:hypothetical protein
MEKEKFVFSPDVKDLREIDKIVEQIDRYGSRDEFLRESIDMMITWWRNPLDMTKKSAELWSDYTPEMKSQIKEMAPEFYNQMESPAGADNKKSYLETFTEKVQKSRNFLKSRKITVFKECIPSSSPPLMNKLHTRFFPSKIVTCLLAKSVVENIEQNNSEWIDYESFRKNSFEEVLEISKIIKQYEDENKVSRNERISTGFPAFHEKTFENKEDELKNMLRIKASKERFLEQFVGPTTRAIHQNSNGTISGMLNDTGLVQIRKKDDSLLEITLSEDGIKFLMLPNPIIDNQNLKHSMSKEEKDFILVKVMPIFDLEKRIISGIMKSIEKSQDMDTKQIDAIIDIVKTKWFNDKSNTSQIEKYNLKRVDEDYWKNVRISTMGRLSEIGAIKWIIEKGSSVYLSRVFWEDLTCKPEEIMMMIQKNKKN